MSQPPQASAALLVASALTKIHPGAGRSPGVVDLPVIRDPIGYPFIPGTMLKGSLKTLLYNKYKNARDNQEKIKSIECLFGPEPREEEKEKYAGALTFGDLYPFLIPVPSSNQGVVYVTTPYLIAKAVLNAQVANIDISLDDNNNSASLSEVLTNLIGGEDIENPIFYSAINRESEENSYLTIGAFTIRNLTYRRLNNELSMFFARLRPLNPLYNMVPIENRILVIPEKLASHIVNAALLRVTRVRLDRTTKTVSGTALWTEEYIPWGTLFTGVIIDNRFRGNNCKENNIDNPVNELDSLLRESEDRGEARPTFPTIVLGGKETVGSGLVSIDIMRGGQR